MKDIKNELQSLKERAEQFVRDIDLLRVKIQEFKIPGWYKFNISEEIERFRAEWQDEKYLYNKKEGGTGYSKHLCTPMIKVEIEEHLLKICNEKYPEGVTYQSVSRVSPGKKVRKGKLRCCVTGENEYVTDGNGGAVYENGKFAEIIPDKLKRPETRKEFEEFINDCTLKYWDETLTRESMDDFLSQYDIK